jgi:ATPase subunit of ABC transporter with duplicated ATPase domains
MSNSASKPARPAKPSKYAKNEFAGETIIRFESVSFEYGHNKPILEEASFTVRRGTKITLMGQNGAGKTTIFGLILGVDEATGSKAGDSGKSATDGEVGVYRPEAGEIYIANGATIATARQVIPRPDLELTVREFFAKALESGGRPKVYDLEPRIKAVLEAVNLKIGRGLERGVGKSSAPLLQTVGKADTFTDRLMKTFSGGQQARLLLASALIQDPDILLLDEPTNNLDKAGIEHLTKFLVDYRKTCLVISHDAEFLNAFTHGVLYLDVHTRKVEQYVGDYKDVVGEISARIEKENMENARLQKEIEAKKYQAGVFANKGGQMRLVAKRMREKAEELSEEIVDVRKEDKTIKPFVIPAQPDLVGEVISIDSYSMISPTKHKAVNVGCSIKLRKKQHLLISGPNGIGKSSLLEKIVAAQERNVSPQDTVSGSAEPAPRSRTLSRPPKGPSETYPFPVSRDITIAEGIRVGYYRQDFSMMDFNDTVYQSLEKIVRSVEGRLIETELRATAASFLIGADAIHTKIGSLSEGQKGLVAFARLVLQKPGLLILDEPTNHINFRHLPVIAKALDAYEGAMILVSHVPGFVKQIRIDEILTMGK